MHRCARMYACHIHRLLLSPSSNQSAVDGEVVSRATYEQTWVRICLYIYRPRQDGGTLVCTSAEASRDKALLFSRWLLPALQE